jgi:hypothetical protein
MLFTFYNASEYINDGFSHGFAHFMFSNVSIIKLYIFYITQNILKTCIFLFSESYAQ